VHAHPAFPHVPPALRVAVERSARRLAGYWHGRKLAEAFLGLYQPGDPTGTAQALEDYIQKQDDPRVVEIMRCLAEEL
jgi:hydrogenase-4 component I